MFHNYFFPFTEGFRYADANSLESLEAAAGDDVCAVMLELARVACCRWSLRMYRP